MKKKIFLLALVVFPLNLKAQIETEKIYKNEFGIDATSFIFRFLKLDFEEFQYTPNYYLTYRRKFKCGNIRFAIGGSYEETNVVSPFIDDENDYNSSSNSLDARIGWEFKNDLSKKWQVFYGLDFRPSFYRSKNDAMFWNGGYANGIDYKAENYGFAPLLGFRFWLNSRLSLSTEASFSVNFQKKKTTYYFMPIVSSSEPLPNEEKPAVKSIFSSFRQPLMVFITFDI